MRRRTPYLELLCRAPEGCLALGLWCRELVFASPKQKSKHTSLPSDTTEFQLQRQTKSKQTIPSRKAKGGAEKDEAGLFLLDVMTDLERVEQSAAFSTYSVHASDTYAPVLTIAKPALDESHGKVTAPTSSVHFRDQLAAVQSRVRGSQLVLTLLGTESPSTVLEFGSPVRNVGLHDDSSNLIVHVFLESQILYSMILTPSSLEDPTLKKPDGWITEFSAPSFQIRSPLYMHSISASSIIFSLEDGGLLRLSNNGRGYNEHLFSDSSYFSSFKSILPWSGRPSNLVISMQACPSKNLLFTMSVDAKLKVWDISKGSLLAMKELFAHPPNFLLEPIPSQFLTVTDKGAHFYLAAYCPGKPGLFRIFRGKASGIDEIYSTKEVPPSSGLWLVFDVAIGQVNDLSIQLHVLWKLDNLSLLQTASISLSTRTTTWSFASSRSTLPPPPESNTESIEDFVFVPGRFSASVLRSALELKDASEIINLQELRALASRMIKESVQLQIDAETGNELTEQYMDEVRLKYLKLARICIDYDRMADEAHTLVSSDFSSAIAIAQTEKLSLVDPSTKLEFLIQQAKNTTNTIDSRLLSLRSSQILADGMSADQMLLFAQALREECLNQRTLSADDAMFVMYEKLMEGQVPRATAVLLQEMGLSAQKLTEGLSQLLPHFQPRLLDSFQNVLGVDGYVASNQASVSTALKSVTELIAFLIHAACSSDEVEVYQASTLYIEYLEIHKQLILFEDTMTKLIVEESKDDEVDGDSSMMTVLDRSAQSKLSNTVVFKGLALDIGGKVPTKEFLERTLVYLVNAESPTLAMHFSQFVDYQPFASYLQARSLLLESQYAEAATAFARNGYPLVSSPKSKVGSQLKTKLTASNLVEYHLHVASLFAALDRHEESLRFCTEAELAAVSASPEHKQEVKQRLFTAALRAHNWDEAYRSMLPASNDSLKRQNVRDFLTALCESRDAKRLASFPCTGFTDLIDSTMETKARNMLDVRSRPAWHKLLYAFRVQHRDFRGAASIIYHRVQFLQNRSHVTGFNVTDHLEVTEGYLLIINALSCVAEQNAWIIVGHVDVADADVDADEDTGTDRDRHQTDTPAKRIKLDTKDGRSSDVMGEEGADHDNNNDNNNNDTGDDNGNGTRKSGPNVVRKVLQLKDIRGEYIRELSNMDAQLQQLAGLAY